jgi:hypothetical protein
VWLRLEDFFSTPTIEWPNKEIKLVFSLSFTHKEESCFMKHLVKPKATSLRVRDPHSKVHLYQIKETFPAIFSGIFLW